MKTAFWFRLGLRRLRSSDNFIVGVASRSGRFKELNQSQSVRTCMWFVYPSTSSSNSDNLVFTRSWDFDGVVRGVGRKWKRSDPSDSHSVALMTRLTTLIFYFHKVTNALTTPLTTPTPTPSLVKTSRVEITFCSLGSNHAKLDAKFEDTAVFPALLCMFSGFHVLLIQKHSDTLECFQ